MALANEFQSFLIHRTKSFLLYHSKGPWSVKNLAGVRYTAKPEGNFGPQAPARELLTAEKENCAKVATYALGYRPRKL